jgi:hypothetical protein
MSPTKRTLVGFRLTKYEIYSSIKLTFILHKIRFYRILTRRAIHLRHYFSLLLRIIPHCLTTVACAVEAVCR